MPLSRVLLLVSGAAGVLSVAAAVFSATTVSLQCGLVTLATLVGYAVVAGRGAAPRVRWAITAGLALFTAVMALRLSWYGRSTSDVGWFSYGPLDGSSQQAQLVRTAVVGQWRQVIDQERIRAVVRLLGMLCLAGAVLALPVRSRPKRAALTTFVALALLATITVDFWRQVEGVAVLDLLGAAWPALLGVLVATAMLALTGWRAERAWLLPVGALLLAAAAATALDDAAGGWSAWWWMARPQVADTTFLVGVMVKPAPQASAAWEAAAALIGPALCAIGALRASRATPPVSEQAA